MSHAGGFRGVDGSPVLLEPAAGTIQRIGRDDENTRCSLEGAFHRCGIVKIGGNGANTLFRQSG